MGQTGWVDWAPGRGQGDELGRTSALPRVRTQRATEKSHGTSGQPRVAATQTDEPLAQGFLQVACPFTVHRVLCAQPARVGGQETQVTVTTGWMGGQRGLWGHPPWMSISPCPRAWRTHMMKAVTPMAQMSVCGTAPWPSRSSGAGSGHRAGHR